MPGLPADGKRSFQLAAVAAAVNANYVPVKINVEYLPNLAAVWRFPVADDPGDFADATGGTGRCAAGPAGAEQYVGW